MMALAAERGAELTFAGGAAFEPIFPEFHPAYDALYAVAKVMELLATEQRHLSELVALLPAWHLATRRVACPWERKGEIMRTLLDEQRDGDIETIDGIRVHRNGGWVLTLPDASDPMFNVYAEGTDDAEAAWLVDEVAGRIRSLVES
jgi:mannose-1-phosphate guanylyltransferase/phosphomannomutase